MCDAKDYFSTSGLSNLQDTDAVFSTFSHYCSLAGPLRCRLHTGTRPSDISARLSTLLTSLRTQPIPAVPLPQSPTDFSRPETITFSDVQSLIFKCLYNPVRAFPLLADALADLESGSTASFLALAQNPSFSCSAKQQNTGAEADTAILCSDGGAAVKDSLAEFSNYLSALRMQSEGFAGIWAKIRMGCVGWKMGSKGLVHHGPIGGETRRPVLFVGNTLDPVTPLQKSPSPSPPSFFLSFLLHGS